jgi:hypothetical protein
VGVEWGRAEPQAKSSRPGGMPTALRGHARQSEAYTARRAKLAQARHQRKEKNLELQQRTLSFTEGVVASD